jgi:hypothetical protein
MFFFSIKLKDINGLGEQYDIDSPWCFPIEVDINNYLYFKRNLGDTGELPDFDRLQNIHEYDDRD